MSARLRWGIAAATALGLGLALWTIGRVGLRQLAEAALRVGAGGFLLLCLLTGATLAVLGAACLAAMPGEPRRHVALFAWSRTVRDGASELLPFSHAGALALGARVLVRGGIAPARVYAAMIVDLTAEMASQAVFTLGAVLAAGGVLAGGRTGALAWAGIGVSIVLALAFALLQRPALRLIGGFAGRLVPGAGAPLGEVEALLAVSYRARGVFAASFLLNLAAWGMTALFAWVALRMMGAGLGLARAVALESLILALRAAAFVVPAALGVQEAGYMLLAPLFALDPRLALALSLLKRARDVAIGVPALVACQMLEVRPRGP